VNLSSSHYNIKTRQMKNLKTILIAIVSLAILTSCSSDDDSSSSDDITTAEITLNNSNGEPVSGITVYAYSEETWSVIGDDPLFADFQSTSESDGVASFSNLTSDLTFNEINNFTHTFRFSAHYTLNGTDKIKVKAITFDLGDDKSDTIILD